MALTNDSKKNRISNFELLKIFSALLIIAYHAKRNFTFPAISFSTSFTNALLGSWGILGVDLFLLISCWFLADKPTSPIKPLKLLLQLLEYSVIYFYFWIIYRWREFGDLSTLLATLGPQIKNRIFKEFWKDYWYVKTYIVFLLLCPWLNKFKLLNKNEKQRFLFTTSLIPILAQWSESAFADVAFFCYVYLIVLYIKTEVPDFQEKIRGIYGIGLFLIIFAVSFYIEMTPVPARENGLPYILSKTLGNTGRNSLVMLALAFCIFTQVLKQKPFYSAKINKNAGLTLGVYLFHENYTLLSNNTTDIFARIFSGFGCFREGSNYFITYIIFVLCIYLFGCIFETIRQKLFSGIEKKVVGKVESIK